MRAADVVSAPTPPLAAQARPAGRRFTDREYLDVVYRTHPDAARAVVPEPLEVDEPLVRISVEPGLE